MNNFHLTERRPTVEKWCHTLLPYVITLIPGCNCVSFVWVCVCVGCNCNMQLKC